MSHHVGSHTDDCCLASPNTWSVLPNTIMLSFIPPFPWGISITVSPTRRKAFFQKPLPQPQEQRQRTKFGKEHRPMEVPKTVPTVGFCISGYCPSNNHHQHKEGAMRAFIKRLISMHHFKIRSPQKKKK